DIFWEEALKPWDVAGGILLVREAGGEVTGCLDERFDMFKPDILATNGSRRLARQFKERVLY
ncbi:MAG TPA: inositol monophosphatase family protein, partial [Mesotoga infera]|nr:inositol monophosphatase family protein [Mesotoga infera]